MADLSGVLWLARRQAFDRATIATTLATFGALVLLTLLALATVVLPVAQDRTADREAALTPRTGNASADDTESGLLVLEPEIANQRRWRGHAVERFFYASPGRLPERLTAPGIPAMPEPGTYYASPALRELIERDPIIAELYLDQTYVGAIDDQGLAQPHELRSIGGIDRQQVLMSPVVGFGAPRESKAPAEQKHEHARLRTVVSVFAAAMTWVPGVALLAVVAGLASASRRQRTRAMRLVGLARGEIRTVHVASSLAIALPAILVATALYLVATRHLTQIPGTDVGFFSQALAIPWWALAGSLVLPGAAFVLISSRIDGPTRNVPLRRRRRPARSSTPATPSRVWSRLGPVVFVAGAALLIASPALEAVDGFLAGIGLWAGCVLVAIGLACTAPAISRLILLRLARRAKTVGVRVGARLATARTTTSVRLAGLLAVLIVLLLGGAAFTNLLNGGPQKDWDERLGDASYVPTVVADLAGQLSRRSITQLAPRTPAVHYTTLRARDTDVNVVLADCATLSRLAGRPPQNCTGRPQWIGAPAATPPGTAIEVPGGDRVTTPGPEAVVDASNVPATFRGALLLSPHLVPESATFGNGSVLYLLLRNNQLLPVLAAIAAAAPATQVDLGQLDRHNPDTQEFPAEVGLLSAGAVLGLGLGALALLAASVAEARERSQRFRPLRLLGASTKEIARTHMWATSAAPVALAVVATACAWLATTAMQAFDPRAALPTHLYLATLATAIGVALLIGVVTWPGAQRAAPQSGSFDA